MSVLADHIGVSPRYARSANLERDSARPEPLEGYVVTTRALDFLERISATAAAGRAGGAWSLTGPYGSGKSSLALLTRAAFGQDSPERSLALRLIGEASEATRSKIEQAHERYGTSQGGFFVGQATGDVEALEITVARALESAVATSNFAASEKIGKKDPPPPLSHNFLKYLSDLSPPGEPHHGNSSPSHLLKFAKSLAEQAPLLLIIDEFGKNLEAVGQKSNGSGNDPYILQQLAEAGQGAGLPIFLLTLQHRSFDDYLSGTDTPKRREWAKVQGRFEDVAYTESPSQVRALIGTAFKPTPEISERISRWAGRLAKPMRPLGVSDLSDPAVIASCYPLHPLTALVLPELCSRYGQHERSLFSFLSGPETSSAAAFLASTKLPQRGRLPSIGLDVVYDYFADSAAGQNVRWAEIAARLADTHGLTPKQSRIAKSVALLNLVAGGGTLRASTAVLRLLDADAEKILGSLEEAGIVTYREFADEYRIWQGSDIDIRLRLEAERKSLRETPLTQILERTAAPRPVVAARHSAEANLLRVFGRRYVDGSEPVEPLAAAAPYDGEVLLVVGSDTPPQLAATGQAEPQREGATGRGVEQLAPPVAQNGSSAHAKPILAAIPEDCTELAAAAREAAATAALADDEDISEDWVARREAGELLYQAETAVEDAVAAAFESEGCRWALLEPQGPRWLKGGRGSAVLSQAADLAYPDTPKVGNEMSNRSELTAQAAKARRLLLEAMLTRPEEPHLGLTGYGPEVALYRSLLAATGLHRPEAHKGAPAFREPFEGSSLMPAWKVMEDHFELAKQRRVEVSSITAALQAPPIGMKAGAIPVLLTAGLLAHAENVALYELHTFKLDFTADLAERLTRNPDHFSVRHFANTAGARLKVVRALARRLGLSAHSPGRRVGNVLAVVLEVLGRFRRLAKHTRSTAHLSGDALRVREVLAAAREPDELLFKTLPEALGFPEATPDRKTYTAARDYAERLVGILDEFDAHFDALLRRLTDLLLSECSATSRQDVSGLAAAVSREVLNPETQAFVLALADDGTGGGTGETTTVAGGSGGSGRDGNGSRGGGDSSSDNDDNWHKGDRNWIRRIATVVSKKAPAEWNDQDLRRFEVELPQRVAAFHRLAALHAENKADGGGPFDAMRLTVTRPDGSEVVRLLSVDLRQKGPFEDFLYMTLEELADLSDSPEAGQHAQHSLLALLVERLFPHNQPTATSAPRELPATEVSSVAAAQSRPRAAPRELAATGASSA